MGAPEQQAEPELILRGQLQELDLGTLLSALQLGRQYLTLDLFDAGGEHHGSVSVKSGRVVSASAGDKTGADAVRQLLDSTEASEFHVRLQPPGLELEQEPVGTIEALAFEPEPEPEPDSDHEPERTRVVQGVLSESLSLDEVLRVVAFTRQHVIVELSDDAGNLLGDVRAKAGKILSAQAGELVELAAVHELLRAPAGTTFVLYTDPQQVEQLHPLGTLADVLARASESGAAAASVPSNGFRKTLPPPLPGRTRRNSETSPQARILEGSLDEFELSHVLRVLSTSRQHFELHVRDDAAQSVGVIDVKSGFVVGASTESLNGLDAARELLGARSGRFVAIRRAEPTAERPALASVNELLQPKAATQDGADSQDTQPLSQTAEGGKGIPVLDGKLGDLDVASLLRVAAASRQYTGVHIFDKSRRPLGAIYVKGGHIVRANAQEATGLAAIRRLLHSPRDFLFLVQRYPNAPQVTSAIGSIASVLERAGAATTQPAFTAPPPEAATAVPSGWPAATHGSPMGGAVLGAGFVLLGGIATALVMNVTTPAPAPITTLSPITTSPPQPLAPPAHEVKAEPLAAADAANSGSANSASGKNEPASALSKATVASLQAGLHQLGYETGPIDGVVGPRTAAAIKAFQYAEHLQADGTLSPPTRAVLQRRIDEP